MLTAAVVSWVCAGAAAEEDYDFYAGLRYPGAELRADVDVYKVKQEGDGGPIEPGVVLRLPDGRKRCFVRGSFGEEDKKYIMDLYVKEMKRIKAGLDKTSRVKRPSTEVQWPNNAKPGEPGTMQVECEHFIWLSGSQAGSDGDPWVSEKEPDKAQWYRRGSIECAEYFWALNEYAGHLMPYWDRQEQLKYQITVPGTKRDGYKVIPGYAGGGYGGCGIKGAGGGPWSFGVFHEWGHGALPNSIRIGGGEAQADMHQCFADPSTLKGNHHLKVPWRNIFNASMGYGYTMFYNVTGDDPNWGYGWFTCLPHGAEEWSMLQTVARVEAKSGDVPALRARVSDLKTKARAEMDSMQKGARYANGGGWVADTAKVAPTAYVGPNAMVLGNAQVLDQAIVEDYAVVTGSAVVSESARVGGQAVVKGNVKISGYSRTWLSLDGDAAATVLPERPGDKELHQSALWANYAMDRDEHVVLEDWYRFKFGTEGKEKVVRDGCFSGATEDLSKSVYPFLRSASRYSVPPDLGYLAIVGFRVVLGVEIAR